MNPVLDASVFIAAISPSERNHGQAKALLESQPHFGQFLIPDLFRLEVIAGLSRRGEPPELLDTVDAMVRGPRFCACKLDERLLTEAVAVARAVRLRAYDAVYVALALTRGEPLFTLDGEVLLRCREALPAVRVVSVN